MTHDFDERVYLAAEFQELGQHLRGPSVEMWRRKLRRGAQMLLDGPSIAAGRCEWCGGPIPEGKRSDARFCRDAHRKANHRARGTARDGSAEWTT